MNCGATSTVVVTQDEEYRGDGRQLPRRCARSGELLALNYSIRLSLMFSQTMFGTGLSSIYDFWIQTAGVVSTVVVIGGIAQPRHGTLFCYVAKRGTQGVLSGAVNVSGPRVC